VDGSAPGGPLARAVLPVASGADAFDAGRV